MFHQEIDVKAGGGHTITIGEMLRQWLVKIEWYSTLFPRIPVPTQKSIAANLKNRELTMNQAAGVQGEGGAETGSNQYYDSSAAAPARDQDHIPDNEVHFGEAARISKLRNR